ncbi:FAD-binding and (Fe-S)-binding domain-containing protein [Novispirillum itersonii]|uniref:FAD-binding and (Fe-S)-binding domain-containing protein n=1 Tax=Novispirillum itersonii TaxID=189 RepID=UPI00035DE59D|nr:FAD-binding and (Fe-S)-binding domain-containing protein [Novispirillum itersonii]
MNALTLDPGLSTDALIRDLAAHFPAERLVTDRLRRLAWGTDASFYRLIPRVVVVVENEEEVQTLLAVCRTHAAPVTFRAAGTSLSGQAVTDSVLAVLGEGWQEATLLEDGAAIALQPGVVGSDANRLLAPLGRKIGPDPASINSAMVGGIAANNSSGMCCGTAQNTYRTLRSLKVILHDGTLLDTGSPVSRAVFTQRHKPLLDSLLALRNEVLADFSLTRRIHEKFKIKNTTGYSLNALLDFDDPIDILAHLMIGSEGTLGFISEVVLETVPDHPHKATTLAFFETAEIAARAVMELKRTPVAAVELIDAAGLKSIAGKPGLPKILSKLPPQGTALLIEVHAETAEAMNHQIGLLLVAMADVPVLEPVRFTTDPSQRELYWKVRKGLFPLVGALRQDGTTVLIEDIAFPIRYLADGVVELQGLFAKHGYDQGIIFGHALEGNLHFVFAQDFNSPEEVARYAALMDDVTDMVVRFDGSLKAEHGTGRNMAPFVEREWGHQAYSLMVRIKNLLDPENLLNAGVIINDDPEIHLKNLKPLPVADAIVDKCIECGFCEVKCPSAGFTLSPRQRIVGWRELSRRRADGVTVTAEDKAVLDDLAGAYDYAGIDTCAACGLCATACPMGIETGALIRKLRGAAKTERQRWIGQKAADHYDTMMAATRLGLRAASMARALIGNAGMKALLDTARKVIPALPHWRSTMPTASKAKIKTVIRDEIVNGGVVYFPSCAARTMGPSPDDPSKDPLPVVMERLLNRAGFQVFYPTGPIENLCCGQPFQSKGLDRQANQKLSELEKNLWWASNAGQYPILMDTSPCAFRAQTAGKERLLFVDIADFLHDRVLPNLTIYRKEKAVTVHCTCSGQKMGNTTKLKALAAACADRVVTPAGVTCCGFAGDKGFFTPELNRHALRRLGKSLDAEITEGVSTSRTCEIGLSETAGIPYHSIAYLLDRCSTPPAES